MIIRMLRKTRSLLPHKIGLKIHALMSNKGYLKGVDLKKGDTVIDVGACLGHFTFLATEKVGCEGEVIAYESNERNFKILKNKVEESEYENIRLINKAVFNKNTTLDVKGFFGFSTVIDDKFESEKSGEVEAVTLDSEFSRLNLNHVDLVKMDVEGAELEIIEGMKESLNKVKNLAIACYHDRNGTTTGEILKPELESEGFHTRIGHPLHQTLYANK